MAACVVSVINLKGGVGKSTLTMMLGEYLSFRCGKNILLVDMDAQANLSYCMVPGNQIQRQEQEGRTTHHLLKRALYNKPSDIRDYITKPPLVVSNIARSAMTQDETRIHMVVSTPSVAQLDEDLLELWEQQKAMPVGLRHTLKEALALGSDDYDYVLIDCPPGLSVFSSAALVASDYFVAPIIPEPLSLQGVELIQARATQLNNNHGASVEFAGSVLNIVKHYRNTHREVAVRVHSTEKAKFHPFTFWLPDNEKLRKLGEFNPDEQGQWALGYDRKFPSVYAKYSVSYPLTNPADGYLSLRDVEGNDYKLEERIYRLVEEFQQRCPSRGH